MKFVLSSYEVVRPMIQANVEENEITVDSFWEAHVLESNHYAIVDSANVVGYASIHKAKTMTGFYLKESHLQYGKELFEQFKRYEQVTNAMVPTGDEVFLSHCVDNFARMEKQAFFSIYREQAPEGFQRIPLRFERVTCADDVELLKLAGISLPKNQWIGCLMRSFIIVFMWCIMTKSWWVLAWWKPGVCCAALPALACTSWRRSGKWVMPRIFCANSAK